MPFIRLRKRTTRMLAAQAVAVLCLLSCARPGEAGEPGSEIIGTWRFTAVLDLADMASMDEKGAHQLLGHEMTISKYGTQFDGESCQPPDFDTRRVEPALYLQREAGIDNSKLRLPNLVTVIDISCTQVFLRKPGRAVIFWNGFFFDAVRVHQKVASRPSTGKKR